MSSRYGRYFIAFGGLAALAVASWLSWTALQPRQPNIAGYSRPEAPHANHAAGGYDCRPERLRLVAKGPKGLKQREACADAKDSEKASQEALDYSARQANTSEEAVRVAYGQAQIAWWQTWATMAAFMAAVIAAFFAKRAVEVAERALNTIERPHLFMEIRGPFAMPLAQPLPMPYEPIVHYRFKNTGRLKAKVIWVYDRMTVAPAPTPKPVYSDGTLWSGTYAIPPEGGEGHDSECRLRRQVTQQEMGDLATGVQSVFMFGYVEYTDVLGFKHTLGFGVKWDAANQRFTSAGMEAYEYEQSERLRRT